MFGYVCIDKPELKFKDYETYRGVYCSLCKALKKDYSKLATFTLNYDCTFFSLFLLSRAKNCQGFKGGRCCFNPFKKCNYLSEQSESLSKGAALTVILSYYKLMDNINDNVFLKKLGYTFLRPVFSLWHNKAKKKFPEYEDAVREMYFSQLDLEKADKVCLDMAAEPTAKMLKNVLKFEAKNETETLVLSEFGYHLGRWIYLVDAANDLKEDCKKGNFNPFVHKFGDVKNADSDEIDAVISQSYYLLTKAYELIDKHRFTAILDNIIYMGLLKKQKDIIYPERKD